MAGPYLLTPNSALASPVSGVNLLISGLLALFSPTESVPDVEVHSSQPYAVPYGFVMLAVLIGLLAAAFQDPFISLTSPSPRPQSVPAPASLIILPLITFATTYLIYYVTKLYFWLVRKLPSIPDDVSLIVPSFIYAEFGIIFIAAFSSLAIIFDLGDYMGFNSISYWVVSLISVLVMSRVYQVSLRLKSFWAALAVSGVQVGILHLIGAV